MGLTNKMWETQYATMHSYEEYTESDGSTVVVVNWEYYVICKNITGGNHNCVEGTHGYKQESRVAYNNSSNVTKSIDKTTNLPGGATEHKYYEY